MSVHHDAIDAESHISVRSARLLRVAATTLAALALLFLAANLAPWAWGSMRSTDWWSTRFGDAALTLAPGAVLPAGPGTSLEWRIGTTTYGLPGNTTQLARMFGGPVTPRGSWVWETAAGTVSMPAMNQPDAAQLLAGGAVGLRLDTPPQAERAATPRFTDDAARRMRALALLHAAGWPDGTSVRRDDSIPGDAGTTRYVAEPPMPGATTPDLSGMSFGLLPPTTVSFDVDGRLTSAMLWTLVPTTSTPVQVMTAAEAWARLRHHAQGTVSWTVDPPNLARRLFGTSLLLPGGTGVGDQTPQGPVTSVVLERGLGPLDGSDPSHTSLVWAFMAGDVTVGGVVATLPSE